MEFDPLLDIALRAALAGGEAAMRVYADPFEVTQKDDKTPVTEADLASERVIVGMLTKAFPDIPVVSEETVPDAGFASPAARFWVVDPLDGTKEFVARNGEFAVLIGLVENGGRCSGSCMARRSASPIRRTGPAPRCGAATAAISSLSGRAPRRRRGSS